MNFSRKHLKCLLRASLALIYASWSVVPAFASFSHSHAGGTAAHFHADSVWAAFARAPKPESSPIRYEKSASKDFYAAGDQDHAAILGFLGNTRSAAPIEHPASTRAIVGEGGLARLSPSSDAHVHERIQHNSPIIAHNAFRPSVADLPARAIRSAHTEPTRLVSSLFLRGPPSEIA